GNAQPFVLQRTNGFGHLAPPRGTVRSIFESKPSYGAPHKRFWSSASASSSITDSGRSQNVMRCEPLHGALVLASSFTTSTPRWTNWGREWRHATRDRRGTRRPSRVRT